ncbi:hypothetical protein Pla175_45550 [Pirellulimonas nuda]|uniref:Uncharacterized protein n=1 Tax=Pirellulimonas nuda TaxID=2528009 RepID=A0A518DI39_9BACT|nr:hypothetical protein [Pirellulimonas nuda]QDU91135.1 hypothetical protein Pla175_45550 [Pirellulimonas nuda]
MHNPPPDPAQEDYWAPHQLPPTPTTPYAAPKFDAPGVFEKHRPPGDDPDPTDDWLYLGGRIALAGGCYPLVLLCLMLVWGGVVFAAELAAGDVRFDVDAFLGGAMLMLSIAVASGLFGLFWCAAAALAVHGVVALVLRSLQWRPRWDRLGTFCGGLVALVCLGWPAVFFNSPTRDGWTFDALIFFAAGPGLGTIIGQAFGAAAGIRNLAGHGVAKRLEYFRTAAPRAEPFRFSLMQAMWLTFWLCIGLTLLRATNAASVGLVALVCLWLPFQTVTGMAVLWLAWRRERWLLGLPRGTPV